MKRRKDRNSLTPLDAWVNEMASLTQAKNIIWCDGSEEERRLVIGYPVGGFRTRLREAQQTPRFLAHFSGECQKLRLTAGEGWI